MNAFVNHNRRSLLLPSILLVAFVVACYLPLLLNGGIIVDDWGDISQNLGCTGFVDCYKSWFPLFSNRPLAPLPITATTLLFTTHFHYYLIFNTLIYLAAILLTFRIIKKVIGSYPAFIFAFFSSIPMIAMPVIASPINQSTATMAYLYWALGLNCLYSYMLEKSKLAYWLSLLLLLCAFLTYEVILPLIGFSVLLPFIFQPKREAEKPAIYFLKYIAPIILILLGVIIWQKIIAPYIFEIDYSRLAATRDTLRLTMTSWVQIFTNQIPSLFLKITPFISAYGFMTGLLCALGVYFSYQIDRSNYQTIEIHWRFFLVSIICLLCSSLIFVLSGVNAEAGGYQARGLSSTWFALAIFIGSLAAITKNDYLKKILLTSVILFGFLSSISFSIQRDQYIESWKIQNIILQDVLQLTHNQSVPKNAVILGNVPQYLPRNYNNEIIFSQPWDFGSALAILSKQHISGGAVFDSNTNNFHNMVMDKDGLMLDRWWRAPLSNLWFYQYDLQSKKGSLAPISDLVQLKDIITSLGYQLDPKSNHPE